MKKLIKIKSVTDVITNSSTEVFLLKNDEAFKEFNNSLQLLNADYILDNEESLKTYLSDCYKGDEYAYQYLSSFLDANPLADYEFIMMVRDTLKKTFDETWEFVKSCYLPLIGYAIFMVEDDCLSDSQFLELQRICDFKSKHGGLSDRI